MQGLQHQFQVAEYTIFLLQLPSLNPGPLRRLGPHSHSQSPMQPLPTRPQANVIIHATLPII